MFVKNNNEGQKTVASLKSCGTASFGKGVCRETCDASTEFGIDGLGCKGKASTCCISKDSKDSTDNNVADANTGTDTTPAKA
jgi:hypothetical protein